MNKIELSWNDHTFHTKTTEDLYDKVFEVLPFSEPTSGKDFFRVKKEDLVVGIQNIGKGLYMVRIAKGERESIFSGTQSQVLHKLMSKIDEVGTTMPHQSVHAPDRATLHLPNGAGKTPVAVTGFTMNQPGNGPYGLNDEAIAAERKYNPFGGGDE
jgi:hypothetical protein